ncbi:hypothetical protein BC567DRAFT_205082 [Phyllosticta citribraziliensis]
MSCPAFPLPFSLSLLPCLVLAADRLGPRPASPWHKRRPLTLLRARRESEEKEDKKDGHGDGKWRGVVCQRGAPLLASPTCAPSCLPIHLSRPSSSSSPLSPRPLARAGFDASSTHAHLPPPEPARRRHSSLGAQSGRLRREARIQALDRSLPKTLERLTTQQQTRDAATVLGGPDAGFHDRGSGNLGASRW